jgi:hypothetical protein
MSLKYIYILFATFVLFYICTEEYKEYKSMHDTHDQERGTPNGARSGPNVKDKEEGISYNIKN